MAPSTWPGGDGWASYVGPTSDVAALNLATANSSLDDDDPTGFEVCIVHLSGIGPFFAVYFVCVGASWH